MVKNSFSIAKETQQWPKYSKIFQIFKRPQKCFYTLHCGGHYNIKIKHFKHFSGGDPVAPPSCQVGLMKNVLGKSGVRARDGAWQYPRPQPAGGQQAPRSRVRHAQLWTRLHHHGHPRPRRGTAGPGGLGVGGRDGQCRAPHCQDGVYKVWLRLLVSFCLLEA